jgi:hypothetical protein
MDRFHPHLTISTPAYFSIFDVYICQRIASISVKYSQQDAKFSRSLQVSGGSSAHHQEHKTVHRASGIVKPILLPAAIVDEMELNCYLPL